MKKRLKKQKVLLALANKELLLKKAGIQSNSTLEIPALLFLLFGLRLMSQSRRLRSSFPVLPYGQLRGVKQARCGYPQVIYPAPP